MTKNITNRIQPEDKCIVWPIKLSMLILLFIYSHNQIQARKVIDEREQEIDLIGQRFYHSLVIEHYMRLCNCCFHHTKFSLMTHSAVFKEG